MPNVIPYPTSSLADRQRLAISIFRMAFFCMSAERQGDGGEAISSVIDREAEMMTKRLKHVKKSDLPEVSDLVEQIIIDRALSLITLGYTAARDRISYLLKEFEKMGLSFNEQQIRDKISAQLDNIFGKMNITVKEWEEGTRDAERAMEIISALLRGDNHAES